MTIGFSEDVRNAMLDVITTKIGANGLLRLYTGPRPATGGAETTKLVELVCGETFADDAAGGVLTLNAITGANAVASGSAAWLRFLTADGATSVIDGSVGTADADLILNAVAIATGAAVSVASGTITAGNP